MHSQILTDHEREMLNRILEKNEKPKGHRLLKLRVLKYYERLNQDFDLIDHAFKKFQQPPNLTGKPKQKKREG
jgi:hypothetical protein